MLRNVSRLLLSLSLLTTPVYANASTDNAYIDVEQQRLPKAREAMPQITDRYQSLTNNFIPQFQRTDNELTLTQLVARQGQRLWQQAVRDVQSGTPDDRPLYWGRLALKRMLQHQTPGFTPAQWQRNILLSAAEKNSRGITDIRFDADSDIKILLTGFDPFRLDKQIDQSNPSGLMALALDGYTFMSDKRKVQIETVLIPVRFTDFDNGLIESLLTPFYVQQQVDAIITVSMGRDHFQLERFAGKNRSANAPDNNKRYSGATPSHPTVPLLANTPLSGPEYLEFSLPAKAIQFAQGQWQISDNRQVTTLKQGDFSAPSLAALQNVTAVTGSGGGYLSNEITYRALRLRALLDSKIATGHIHTPAISGYDRNKQDAMLEQMRAILQATAAML